MRKLFYSSLLFFIAAALITSCNFKDKGNLDLVAMAPIVIDTTGIPQTHSVTKGQTLIIEPKISKTGIKEEDFSYEWRITRLPGPDFVSHDVISTEKTMNKPIDLDPSSDFYSLWYRVKDKTTGLIESIIFRVVVEGPVTQGLVVAESADGINSDLSIIQDTIFTFNWYQPNTASPLPVVIKRNEFSRVHGRKFDGIIHSLFSQRLYQGQIYRNFLHGASRTNAFRLNTADYSVPAEGKNLFYDEGIALNINTYFKNGPDVSGMVNSGKVSTRNLETKTTVGYNRFGITLPGDYTINEHIAVHPITLQQAIFFDENLGKFLKLGTSINVASKPTEVGTGAAFDPRNLPGYKVLGGGLGNLTEVRFVLKKDNVYSIYTFDNGTTAHPRRLIDISNAPDISSAVGFVFPIDQTVIYYATPTKVYSIRIPQGADVTYTDLYTSPEPINTLTMLRRSGTRTVNNTERCLIATTYNGTEGKVITLPIPEAGLDLGIIDLTKKQEYGGFKKISAVAIQD